MGEARRYQFPHDAIAHAIALITDGGCDVQ